MPNENSRNQKPIVTAQEIEPNPLMASLSERAQTLQGSKIREVANLAIEDPDVIPLWFGEGSWPTHPSIVDAAVRSLQSGVHFYQANSGRPSLRQGLVDYHDRVYNQAITKNRITVTPSGMQAVTLSAELLVTPGDRVVFVEPLWPNLMACYKAMGADVTGIALKPDEGRWSLDMNALLDALTPSTKVFVVNSPNNPTGWTMAPEEQATVLAHCRKHGIWIVSDDVYSRLYKHADHAPAFLSITDERDRFISINSFSKSWSMTGWRLGWMLAPPECETRLAQLTEFNTSCTPGFVQDAGLAALALGDSEIKVLNQRLQDAYAITEESLRAFPSVQFIEPDGAFYAFFKVDGMADSTATAKKILRETGVGLAPGDAFGPTGKGYMRLCYAQPTEVLQAAFDRLAGAF